MKKTINYGVVFATLIAVASFCACKKTSTKQATQNFNINETVLVADTAGFGAAKIDPVLQDAWGLASAPGGPVWIAANHSGESTIYDNAGNILSAPVSIPSVTPGATGAPSGLVYNGTQDFGGNSFIYASEEGIVLGWKSGASAVIVADQSQTGSVYKGITIGSDGGSNFLYVTNFHNSKIDVFDKNFNYVSGKNFTDPGIPAGYGPFNIQNIGGQLYVTYAKLQGPDDMDDQPGAGNGFVDIFNTDGSFVKRFASQGTLNSPWGIALAPAGFANAQSTILIGNFGDGKINVFDMAGNYKGQLQNNGQIIAIAGLWAIDFLQNNQPGGNPGNPLYFTAGPDGEAHGLFGTLQLAQPTVVNNTSSGSSSGGYYNY
jgi:uncharacterized protein (TIGR03118 family)